MAEIIELPGNEKFEWREIEKSAFNFLPAHGLDDETITRILEKYKPLWTDITHRQRNLKFEIVININEGPGLTDYQIKAIHDDVTRGLRQTQKEFNTLINDMLLTIFNLNVRMEAK